MLSLLCLQLHSVSVTLLPKRYSCQEWQSLAMQARWGATSCATRGCRAPGGRRCTSWAWRGSTSRWAPPRAPSLTTQVRAIPCIALYAPSAMPRPPSGAVSFAPQILQYAVL